MILSVINKIYKEQAFAAKYGCQEPKELTSWWPFNTLWTYKIIKADQDKRILSHFAGLFVEYGETFKGRILGGQEVSTVDPVNIDTVLNTKFNDYWFGPARVDSFMPFFGSGIFTQDGVAWKHSRSLLRPQFMHNRTFYFSHIQQQARRMMALIDTQAAGNRVGELDLMPIFFRYTLDTTTAMLFGKPLSAHDDQAAVGQFMDAFTSGQEEVIARFRLGPLGTFVSEGRLKHHTKVCHDFVEGVVKEARQHEKQGSALSSGASEAENDNLLQSLLHLYPDDDIAIRSQLMNILLAGRDTTACLLTWCFRLLALHPQVLRDLYQEIAGLPEAAELDRQDLHVSRSPYLAAVLRETLRLYPSVPANQRVASRMTYLPRGGGPDGNSPVFVPKGCKFSYSAYIVHRRKDIWGDDANHFRPERWIENGGELEKRTSMAYLPFNAGPRICLGQDMALFEAAAGVVHILKAWNGGVSMVGDGELTPDGATGEEKQNTDIMVRPVAGCKVVLSRT